jgi:hypothetical protein
VPKKRKDVLDEVLPLSVHKRHVDHVNTLRYHGVYTFEQPDEEILSAMITYCNHFPKELVASMAWRCVERARAEAAKMMPDKQRRLVWCMESLERVVAVARRTRF